MPLPVFPKHRKWKSCNSIPPAIPLNNKSGIIKQRSNSRYNSNTTMSTKQALQKEIAQWQELVVMSQNSLSASESIQVRGKNGKVNYFDNNLLNGCIGTNIHSKLLNKLNNKTEQSMNTNQNFKIPCIPGNAHFDEALERSLKTNDKQNVVRHDMIKSTITRTSVRNIRNKINATRKKDKGVRNESALNTNSSKSPIATRKISPTMRNL